LSMVTLHRTTNTPLEANKTIYENAFLLLLIRPARQKFGNIKSTNLCFGKIQKVKGTIKRKEINTSFM